MARHMATKTTKGDLDAEDRELLAKLRRLRSAVDKGVAAKEVDAPDVIAELRGRGVDPELIADAYGVTKGRIYQVPPARAGASAR